MERAEFENLAVAQMDAVYRLALQLTRDPDRAGDLVQDTFARALRPATVERFEDRSGDGSGMRAWLFTIAHNTFYSSIKKAARRATPIGEFFDEASDDPLPDQPPPAWDLASLDWEHVDQRLKEAIDELKPEYRQILLMWGIEGLKYREIATICDLPIGTVMSRLHRARKLMADALSGPDGAAAELGIRAPSLSDGNDEPSDSV